MSDTNIINFDENTQGVLYRIVDNENKKIYPILGKNVDLRKIRYNYNNIYFPSESLLSNSGVTYVSDHKFILGYDIQNDNDNENEGGNTISNGECSFSGDVSSDSVNKLTTITTTFKSTSVEYTNQVEFWFRCDHDVNLVKKTIKPYYYEQGLFIYETEFVFNTIYNFNVYFFTIGHDNIIYTYNGGIDNNSYTKKYKLSITLPYNGFKLDSIKDEDGALLDNSSDVILEKNKKYEFIVGNEKTYYVTFKLVSDTSQNDFIISRSNIIVQYFDSIHGKKQFCLKKRDENNEIVSLVENFGLKFYETTSFYSYNDTELTTSSEIPIKKKIRNSNVSINELPIEYSESKTEIKEYGDVRNNIKFSFIGNNFNGDKETYNVSDSNDEIISPFDLRVNDTFSIEKYEYEVEYKNIIKHLSISVGPMGVDLSETYNITISENVVSSVTTSPSNVIVTDRLIAKEGSTVALSAITEDLNHSLSSITITRQDNEKNVSTNKIPHPTNIEDRKFYKTTFVMPDSDVLVDGVFFEGEDEYWFDYYVEINDELGILNIIPDASYFKDGKLLGGKIIKFICKPKDPSKYGLNRILIYNGSDKTDTIKHELVADDEYSFKMPYDVVTIEAVFEEVDNTPITFNNDEAVTIDDSLQIDYGVWYQFVGSKNVELTPYDNSLERLTLYSESLINNDSAFIQIKDLYNIKNRLTDGWRFMTNYEMKLFYEYIKINFNHEIRNIGDDNFELAFKNLSNICLENHDEEIIVSLPKSIVKLYGGNYEIENKNINLISIDNDEGKFFACQITINYYYDTDGNLYKNIGFGPYREYSVESALVNGENLVAIMAKENICNESGDSAFKYKFISTNTKLKNISLNFHNNGNLTTLSNISDTLNLNLPNTSLANVLITEVFKWAKIKFKDNRCYLQINNIFTENEVEFYLCEAKDMYIYSGAGIKNNLNIKIPTATDSKYFILNFEATDDESLYIYKLYQEETTGNFYNGQWLFISYKFTPLLSEYTYKLCNFDGQVVTNTNLFHDNVSSMNRERIYKLNELDDIRILYAFDNLSLMWSDEDEGSMYNLLTKLKDNLHFSHSNGDIILSYKIHRKVGVNKSDGIVFQIVYPTGINLDSGVGNRVVDIPFISRNVDDGNELEVRYGYTINITDIVNDVATITLKEFKTNERDSGIVIFKKNDYI